MSAVLNEIITLLVAGISGIATGIGEGLSQLVQTIFLQMGTGGEVEGLSVFGGVIIIFAGRVYARIHRNMVCDSRKKPGRLNTCCAC